MLTWRPGSSKIFWGLINNHGTKLVKCLRYCLNFVHNSAKINVNNPVVRLNRGYSPLYVIL